MQGGSMKKVAILGLASHYKDAPFYDDDIEIWILNDMYDLVPRYDRLFEMHDISFVKKYFTRTTNTFHYDNLINIDKTVYMQDRQEEIKNSIKYPLEEMKSLYGEYFTNSVSYMLALAIEEGFDEIQLYGVDMAVNSEYKEQRPSCEYFIGIAKGKGINVVISQKSDLLKSNYLYGYEQAKVDNFIGKCNKRLEFLNKQKEQTKRQIKDLTMLLNRTEGAIENLKYTMNIF
jgi:hypothetical protein